MNPNDPANPYSESTITDEQFKQLHDDHFEAVRREDAALIKTGQGDYTQDYYADPGFSLFSCFLGGLAIVVIIGLAVFVGNVIGFIFANWKG